MLCGADVPQVGDPSRITFRIVAASFFLHVAFHYLMMKQAQPQPRWSPCCSACRSDMAVAYPLSLSQNKIKIQIKKEATKTERQCLVLSLQGSSIDTTCVALPAPRGSDRRRADQSSLASTDGSVHTCVPDPAREAGTLSPWPIGHGHPDRDQIAPRTYVRTLVAKLERKQRYCIASSTC